MSHLANMSTIRRSVANQPTSLVLASLANDSSPPAGFSQLDGSDTPYGSWSSPPPPSIYPSVRPQPPTGRYPGGLARPALLGQRKGAQQPSAFLHSAASLVSQTSSDELDRESMRFEQLSRAPKGRISYWLVKIESPWALNYHLMSRSCGVCAYFYISGTPFFKCGTWGRARATVWRGYSLPVNPTRLKLADFDLDSTQWAAVSVA